MANSADFDNTNRASLFKNDRKTQPKQPDYKGDACVVCPHCGAVAEHWLSAWIKPMRNKVGKWMSISIQPKEEAKAIPPAKPLDTDFDDDIPF